MLIGFKPDEIEIDFDMKETIRKDVIVGIYNNGISKKGGYSGLVGLEILDERSEKI